MTKRSFPDVNVWFALAVGEHPLTNSEAWQVYDRFGTDARVRVFPELPALEDLFRSFTAVTQLSAKLWADAYLAAHAAANQATLVTFDQAFQKFPIAWRILA